MKKKSKKGLKLSRKKLIALSVAGLIVLGGGAFGLLKNDKDSNESSVVPVTVVEDKKIEEVIVEPEPETTPEVVDEQKPTPAVAVPRPSWPVLLTPAEASSLTVVVNKKHKLPSDYVPELVSVSGGQLRSEAAQALTKLLSAADNAGVSMSVLSSYRSYTTQVSTYNKWVNQSGQAQADTFSARPGHSEHQTGLAVDLGNGTCNLETCFGNTATGKWLAKNAQNYGFIVRYPSGKDTITGYQYEPWHLRYVGTTEAKAIVASGQTMDEYYDITAGDYQ